MDEIFITISEFRRNTKVILDGTKVKPVVLRRGDELFILQDGGTIFSPKGLRGINAPGGVNAPQGVGTLETPPEPEKKNNSGASTWVEVNPARKSDKIRERIAALEAELSSGINQDPDFITSTRQAIQDLWAQYHLERTKK